MTLFETVFDAAGGESDLAFRDADARYQYELLSSDSVATRITTDASGIPVISHPNFTSVLNQARSIVGLAFGANFSLSRSVRVHGGAFLDPSPGGAPSQSIFRAVDLTGMSGGVSLGSGSLTASLGVSSSWGTTTEQEVGPSLGRQTGTTNVSTHTFTGLYSISFTF